MYLCFLSVTIKRSELHSVAWIPLKLDSADVEISQVKHVFFSYFICKVASSDSDKNLS